MTQTTLDYSQVISGDTKIEHTDLTIASGETVKQYAPLTFDSASGHYKVVASDSTAAQFLSSFAVDASSGATKHRAIKAIAIDPQFVAYPDGMTEAVKAGLFAGTPINVQSPHDI